MPTNNGTRSSLSTLSVAALERELARRRNKGQAILRTRDRLARKLAKLDRRIAEMGLTTRAGRSGGGTRPHNETSLVDAMAKTLKGKTMGVGEVAEAVQKAGYRTTSPNFRVIVNQQLLASGKFKRVERGRYTAK